MLAPIVFKYHIYIFKTTNPLDVIWYIIDASTRRLVPATCCETGYTKSNTLSAHQRSERHLSCEMTALAGDVEVKTADKTSVPAAEHGKSRRAAAATHRTHRPHRVLGVHTTDACAPGLALRSHILWYVHRQADQKSPNRVSALPSKYARARRRPAEERIARGGHRRTTGQATTYAVV